MVHKQMFAGSSGDTERTLIEWALLDFSPSMILNHSLYLTRKIATSWDRPLILNSFRQ